MTKAETQKIDHEKVELYKKVDQLFSKNGQSQIFNRAFLRPIDIILKDWKTQNNIQKLGHLPYGLKQAVKRDMDDNKFPYCDFPVWNFEPTETSTYQDFQSTESDNLISVLKSNKNSSIKLAICICMYNEDKTSLRKTLDGVKKNIGQFINNGIPSHQIVVCVVMDGIELVHESVADYFEQLEMQNGIYLVGDIEQTSTADLLRENQDQVEEQEITNISHIVFGEQFEDRKKRQFSVRKKKYLEVAQMIRRIQSLEKDKTTNFQTLDEFIKPFFCDIARQKYKQEYALDDDIMKTKTNQFLIQQYAYNLNSSKPLIREALSLAKRHCNQYLTARQNLALLNSYRVSINIPQIQPDNIPAQGQAQRLNEDDSDNIPNTAKMNLFFITKYKNKGKLTSHNWFFNGICQQLNPQFTVLLDVGLVPEKDALFKMIQHMQNKQKVGGVCGYMGLKIERVQEEEEVKEQNVDCITSFCMNFVDIQRAQQLQYHFAHLIDKPFQSCFDFIHVLPGAFSAYRMKALKPGKEDSKLLKDYFQSINGIKSSQQILKAQYTVMQVVMKVLLPDFFYEFCFQTKQSNDQKLLYNQNVYLAEDRTLCLGIYLNKFNLQYLPDAHAWVDPMKTLYGLLGQRKRWINGSFFAFSKVNKQLSENGQGTCALAIQIFYLQFMNMLAFVAPALFLFTIHIAMYVFYADVIVAVIQAFIFVDDSIRNSAVIFVHTVDFIYVLIFLGLVFFSMHLTHRQTQFQGFVYGTATAYGIISLIVFIILFYDIINGLITGDAWLIENPDFVKSLPGDGALLINILRFIIIGIMGLYLIPILIYYVLFCRIDIIIDIVLSAFSFLFYGPTYLNILNIYALCRIDDISWGTKGLDTGADDNTKKLAANWKKIKLIHVSKFVFWNGVVGFILIALGSGYTTRFFLTFIIMCILAFTMIMKVILGLIYLCKYRCCRSKNRGRQTIIATDQVDICYKKVSKIIKKHVKKSMFQTGKQFIEDNSIAPKNLSIVLQPGISRMISNQQSRKRKNQQLWKSKISHMKKPNLTLDKFENKQQNKQSGKQLNQEMQIILQVQHNSGRTSKQQAAKVASEQTFVMQTSLDGIKPNKPNKNQRLVSETSSNKQIQLVPDQYRDKPKSKVSNRRAKPLI